MNRPPTLCLFCGQPGNMSKQHVFPDRLSKLLPELENPERTYGGRNETIRRGKVVYRDSDEKRGQGTPAQFRIRKVCKSCNHGWLKKMEEECIPLVERILGGETPVLLPPDQERLAKVAMSIAMVGEWITLDQVAPSTTQAERKAFMDTLRPPPGWFVFIGRDGSSPHAPRFLSDGSTVSDGRNAPAKNYSSFTMTIGPLILHVISLRDGIFIHPDAYAEELGLASICPTTDWINFALMPALTTKDITRIRAYARQSFRKMFG